MGIERARPRRESESLTREAATPLTPYHGGVDEESVDDPHGNFKLATTDTVVGLVADYGAADSSALRPL